MSKTKEILGEKAEALLNHKCTTIGKEHIHLPGVDFIDRCFSQTNRSNQVLRSLQALYGNGRLADTGYVSILPVDQGIEHSGGASFAPNPSYFDPENIIKLAIEGGCNAVASTFGVLAACSRKYAHRIPFIVKLNHNEFLTYPNTFNQISFGLCSTQPFFGKYCLNSNCDINFTLPLTSNKIALVDVVPWSIATKSFFTILIYTKMLFPFFHPSSN